MKLGKAWVFLFLFLFIGCSTNFFDELAKKDTQEARFFQAKMEINDKDYSAAIVLLESLDASFLGAPERRSIYASAYSGRCGLDLLSLLEELQDIGTATVLGTLMAGFPGAVGSNVNDCIRAEGIIEGFGAVGDRSGDENLLMMFNAFTKSGTQLVSVADLDGDGVADAGFNVCTGITDNQVREIGTGIAHVILSGAGVGSGYVDDATTSITAMCAQPGLSAFCNKTNEADFTDSEVDAIRATIGSSDFGIDSCSGAPGSDLVACAAHVGTNCPSPNP